MIAEALLDMARRQLSVEDRVSLTTHLLASCFAGNDIDLALALVEKRYQLLDDGTKREAQATLIRFLREINTLRPHAATFISAVAKQINESKCKGGCDHDH